MAHKSKSLVFLIVAIILLSTVSAKPKVSRIDDTNFEKFQKDGSYWIIQISNTPCP
jgi:hypothetical protein